MGGLYYLTADDSVKLKVRETFPLPSQSDEARDSDVMADLLPEVRPDLVISRRRGVTLYRMALISPHRILSKFDTLVPMIEEGKM